MRNKRVEYKVKHVVFATFFKAFKIRVNYCLPSLIMDFIDKIQKNHRRIIKRRLKRTYKSWF